MKKGEEKGESSGNAVLNDSSGLQSRGLRACSDVSQFAVQQRYHWAKYRARKIRCCAVDHTWEPEGVWPTLVGGAGGFISGPATAAMHRLTILPIGRIAHPSSS
jgi:hypothetical protein